MRGCIRKTWSIWLNEEVAGQMIGFTNHVSRLTCGVMTGIYDSSNGQRTETGDIRCCKGSKPDLAGKSGPESGVVWLTARSAHKKSVMKKPDTDGKVNPPRI